MKAKYIGRATIIVALLIILIFVGYRIDATGFNGYRTVTTTTTVSSTSPAAVTKTEQDTPPKSFWDWMQLLIVPFVLAIGGFLFNRATSRAEQANTKQRYENDQKIAADKQKDELLQTYLDRMSDLLLNRSLRSSKPEDEVRYIARSRTLTALSQLDGRRKRSLLQFLRESNLITKEDTIIQLVGADLSGINLSYAEVGSVNLSRAVLNSAKMSRVDLGDADLRDAKLRHADLSNAYLTDADMSSAILSDANLSYARLVGTILNRATLSCVNMSGADLSNANLCRAKLDNTDMSGAYLRNADMSGAYFYGANLNGADLKDAILDGADFTGAKITKEQLASAISIKNVKL